MTMYPNRLSYLTMSPVNLLLCYVKNVLYDNKENKKRKTFILRLGICYAAGLPATRDFYTIS